MVHKGFYDKAEKNCIILGLRYKIKTMQVGNVLVEIASVGVPQYVFYVP